MPSYAGPAAARPGEIVGTLRLLAYLAAAFALILLDLHLPKLNGFEVLQRIRGREETKWLPVVVFSNSGQDEDVRMSCDLHANSYVQKDIDIDAYESRLKLLLYYWFGVHRPAV